jgi:hypothetical protein
MPSDPITDEIRAIRRRLAAECGNDLAKIFADARQREASDGRKYVTLPPRRIEGMPEEASKPESQRQPAST